MDTKDLFGKIQKIDDELRGLIGADSSLDKYQKALRIQDIATKFATTIVDLTIENAVLKGRLWDENKI